MNSKEQERRPRREPREMHVMNLIHEITRITHDRIKRNCPEMQRSCRLIMMELAHRDNVTQLDLVHATHLKAPTVSVSLQKMERDGLVLRRPDEDDLRATRVFLTEKGRAMDRSIVTKIRENEHEIENCLSEEELKTLRAILLKILNNLIGGVPSREED